MKPLPDNRLVILQIYGSYGRNGLKPTRPLTTNDYFRKIASSAFTLYCLFKVNKVWGTDNDKHFYFLTKSIYRSFQIFLWFACRSKFLFSLLEFLHTTWKKSHKTEGTLSFAQMRVSPVTILWQPDVTWDIKTVYIWTGYWELKAILLLPAT